MTDWDDPSVRERWIRYHRYLTSHSAQTCQIYYRTDELRRYKYPRDSALDERYHRNRERYYNALEEIKYSKRQQFIINALRSRLKASRKSDGYHRCCWN